MSMDWEGCYKYTSETAHKIHEDCLDFVQQEKPILFLFDVYTQKAPPLIILALAVQATDNKRAEIYNVGNWNTILNEAEKDTIGNFVGRIVEKYNLVCSKGYCNQNARMVYYIKPRYGDWEIKP